MRSLLTLQGTMKPHQIITLMQYAGHGQHVRDGRPRRPHPRRLPPALRRERKTGKATAAVIKPGQWSRLIGQLSSIENPAVPLKPSRYAVKVKLKVRSPKG